MNRAERRKNEVFTSLDTMRKQWGTDQAGYTSRRFRIAPGRGGLAVVQKVKQGQIRSNKVDLQVIYFIVQIFWK
jgi:hypothetical protein